MGAVKEIAERGVTSAPYVGKFQADMFAESRERWSTTLKELYHMASLMPEGQISVKLSRKSGYIYAYLEDTQGNLLPMCFTHEVIAGWIR